MGIWIRSQGKMNLLYTDAFYIGSNNSISAKLGDGFAIISNYDTDERALEVLDEIQDFIFAGGGTNSNRIYTMPKE